MHVRLKITGGYGGPATWQDLQLDVDSVNAAELTRIKTVLEMYVGNQGTSQFESLPNIPDGRIYDFEIGEGVDKRTLSLNDGGLPPDVAEVIQLIYRHSL
jgi:hypothetical protein